MTTIAATHHTPVAVSTLTTHTTLTGAQWPLPIAQEAFHGLAGDIIHTVAPYTEADPVAVLVQFLVGFGNLVGRNPYFSVEADKHHTNLFAVIVGKSAMARKGVSWGQAKQFLFPIDEEWTQGRVKSGLSSGEGLIYAVRDAKERSFTNDEGEKETQVVDDGVEDKRLLVVESEFASALAQNKRDGNTLSAFIRDGWDRGNLSVLTRNTPEKATNAHISIIGHITRDELNQAMDKMSALNGFTNRFLWFAVQRSQVLPEGSKVPQERLEPLLQRVEQAVSFAQEAGELTRTAEARALWAGVYPALTRDADGLIGSITARATAQVVRLSCVYALLHRSKTITPAHLRAALAVWEYAESSAAYIFGDTPGNPIADKILLALRSHEVGLTRNDIRQQVFGGHIVSSDLEMALKLLLSLELACCEPVATGGRGAQRWRAVHLAGMEAD